MSYSLEFKIDALKEWKKLDNSVREQFKRKLEKVLINPCIQASRLSGFGVSECYKIKLKQSGYRLVYEVVNDKLTVIVVGVGKRDKNKVYNVAKTRLDDEI
jgi:mRNA interferase RelE/StbE